MTKEKIKTNKEKDDEAKPMAPWAYYTINVLFTILIGLIIIVFLKASLEDY